MRLSVILCFVWGLSCSGPSGLPTQELPPEAPEVPSEQPSAQPDIDTSRVVTLGAGVTELAYALGAGERVVAADSSSRYPAAAADKAVLGFFRKTSAEGVLAQTPTLVLAGEGSGPPTALEQLETAGVHVEKLPGVVTLTDVRARIRRMGEVLGAEARADELVQSVDAELAQVRASTASLPAVRVLFIYARGGGTMMVAGDETSARTLIEAAGGTMAFSGEPGFRPLTAEAVALAAPDVILLTDGGLAAMGGVEGVLGAPGVSATPAARGRRVVAVDDHLLLGMGPRTGEAVRVIAGLIHADLAVPAAGEAE